MNTYSIPCNQCDATGFYPTVSTSPCGNCKGTGRVLVNDDYLDYYGLQIYREAQEIRREKHYDDDEPSIPPFEVRETIPAGKEI